MADNLQGQQPQGQTVPMTSDWAGGGNPQQPQTGTTPMTSDWGGGDSSTSTNQTQNNQSQDSFMGRLYESSGAKGLVDIVKGTTTRPIDLYHQAVEQYKAGDWKGATESAAKLVRILPDKNDPLQEAARNLVMQPVNEIMKPVKASYETSRGMGRGVVESAARAMVPTPGDKATEAGQSAIGNTVDDKIKHIIGSVPVLGPTVNDIAERTAPDIQNKNYKLAAADVLGPLLSLGATEGLGEAADAIKGANAARVAGDVSENALRPGTVSLAGHDIPASVPQLAKQGFMGKIFSKGVSPRAMQDFIDNHIQPEVVKANVSNIGQGANKLIDDMRSLRGQPGITQNPVSFTSLDDLANKVETEAKPTFTALDQAAQPDIQAWDRAQKAWDAQNPKPEPPEGTLAKPVTGAKPQSVTPSERAVYLEKAKAWKADQAQWLEDNPKPKSFRELQDQINDAMHAADSGDQVTKGAARQNLPKYYQEMDDFINKYGQGMNPNELGQAKQLWKSTYRYRDLADRMRSALRGTEGTSDVIKGEPMNLDYDKLKSIPSTFDNKFGDGAFEDLLGKQSLDNYNRMLNLLKNPVTRGVSFRQFATSHLGAGLAIRGAINTIPLIDNIMLNPTAGRTFINSLGNVVKAGGKTASAAAATIPSTAAKRQAMQGASGLAGK